MSEPMTDAELIKERSLVVAYLRHRADEIEIGASNDPDIRMAATALRMAADDIADGDHADRASVGMVKQDAIEKARMAVERAL